MKKLMLFSLIMCVTIGFGQVGIGTLTPLSTLDINGNVSFKVVDLDGRNFANKAPINDGFYLNLRPNNGGPNNGNDFELPNAALVPGRMYILRNVKNCDDAYIYSIGPSQFFAGNSRTATAQPITMGADCANTGSVTKTLMFISDGINWTYGPFGF
ncbi:MAG: hypothetical protein R2783_03475 [Gelidibacter sp.]